MVDVNLYIYIIAYMKIIVSLYMMNIIFLSFKDRIGTVLSSVIKPGPAGQVDPGTGPVRSGFVKIPVSTMTRSNPVNLAGQPVTRATRVRPGQDLVFFFPFKCEI
jgi:hypothetical protein